MAFLVQAQSLQGYRELVADLGGNPSPLLRRAGVSPAALSRLTAFISFETLADLLERSRAELHCPDFGFRLAERQDIGILGTLAVAIRYSATVGEALQVASKYFEIHNAALAFTSRIEHGRGEAWLEFRLRPQHHLMWAQTAEHGIGLSWRILTLLSEGRCQLRHVWFPHSPVTNEATYRARFSAPLTFRADHAVLAIAESDLNLPISESVQDLHDAATRYLDNKLSRGRTVLTVQVRQAVEALLDTGTCTNGEVAKALYMHPRTLQRRLRAEGTTFEFIKDSARRDLADKYLAQPDLPLTQIAALLGYSEQSALGRSCRRWFNTTPRELRHHAEPGTSVRTAGVPSEVLPDSAFIGTN